MGTRFFLMAAMCIFFMASNSNAETVYCVNCSDKWQQAIEKATGLDQLRELGRQVGESVVQTEQQIRMVLQNIEQYENMITNTINLPVDIYRDLERQYQKLASLYQQIEMSSGDLDGIRRAYKGLYPSMSNVMTDFSGSYDNWSERVDKSNQAIVELSSIQLEDLMKDKSGVNSQVNSLLSTPAGRMQAIQAGNQLTAMQIQEARELRTLLAASIQEQAAVNAKKEKVEQAEQEHMRYIFAPREEPLNPRKATGGPLF